MLTPTARASAKKSPLAVHPSPVNAGGPAGCSPGRPGSGLSFLLRITVPVAEGAAVPWSVLDAAPSWPIGLHVRCLSPPGCGILLQPEPTKTNRWANLWRRTKKAARERPVAASAGVQQQEQAKTRQHWLHEAAGRGAKVAARAGLKGKVMAGARNPPGTLWLLSREGMMGPGKRAGARWGQAGLMDGERAGLTVTDCKSSAGQGMSAGWPVDLKSTHAQDWSPGNLWGPL